MKEKSFELANRIAAAAQLYLVGTIMVSLILPVRLQAMPHAAWVQLAEKQERASPQREIATLDLNRQDPIIAHSRGLVVRLMKTNQGLQFVMESRDKSRATIILPWDVHHVDSINFVADNKIALLGWASLDVHIVVVIDSETQSIIDKIWCYDDRRQLH